MPKLGHVMSDDHKRKIADGLRLAFERRRAGVVKDQRVFVNKRHCRITVQIPDWVRVAKLSQEYEKKMLELLADAEIDAASHCRDLKNGK